MKIDFCENGDVIYATVTFVTLWGIWTDLEAFKVFMNGIDGQVEIKVAEVDVFPSSNLMDPVVDSAAVLSDEHVFM